MKIDERGLQEVEEVLANAGIHPRAAQMIAMKCLEAYLAALPSAEPGRDRIAVVVDEDGDAIGWSWHDNWDGLQFIGESHGMRPPFARAIIEVNLPRPNETPVVSGSVLRAL